MRRAVLGFSGYSINFPIALSPTPLPATFPQAPLRSRTVGFPESGSDLGCPPTAFPYTVELTCWLMSTPAMFGFPVRLGRGYQSSHPGSVSRFSPRPAQCPEPLCTPRVLPPVPCRLAARQPALPHLPRAYGLMRQSEILLVPRCYPRPPDLCRRCQPRLDVGPSQCYRYRSVPTCLDPYSGCLQGAYTRFFPCSIGLPHGRTGSALGLNPDSDFRRGLAFGAAVIHSCSDPPVCSPPWPLLPSHPSMSGSRGFYVRAYHGSLPLRAADMLTVYTGQLTVPGLTPG